MSDSDVPDGDMPNFPWSDRPGAPLIEDASVTALLAGTSLPGDAPAEMEPVADVLAALRAQPADDELASEAIAMVEFRLQFGTSTRSPRRSPRRRITSACSRGSWASKAIAERVSKCSNAVSAASAV